MEVDAAGNEPRCGWRPETPPGSARVEPDLPGPPQRAGQPFGPAGGLGTWVVWPRRPQPPAARLRLTRPFFAFHPQWSPA